MCCKGNTATCMLSRVTRGSHSCHGEGSPSSSLLVVLAQGELVKAVLCRQGWIPEFPACSGWWYGPSTLWWTSPAHAGRDTGGHLFYRWSAGADQAGSSSSLAARLTPWPLSCFPNSWGQTCWSHTDAWDLPAGSADTWASWQRAFSPC